MKGTANIAIANVDDEEKEVITLSYYAKECGSLKSAKDLKAKIDDLVEESGGETTKTSNTND